MCCNVPGELILCFSKVDRAAKMLIEDLHGRGEPIFHGIKIETTHVQHVESLEEKLSEAGLRTCKDLDFEFHRVRVPIGEEQWKIPYLQYAYKLRLLDLYDKEGNTADFWEAHNRSDYQFTVGFNNLLSLTSKAPKTPAVRAASFRFGPFHGQYKKMMRIQSAVGKNLNKTKIAILDTGIANDVAFPIADRYNFVDPQHPDVVIDDHGHGTVVSLIIHDLAPEAQMIIYKVADANGRASEWDTLAATVACADANVVNLSLEFGLGDRVCKTCGRESHSSRSAVFENLITQLSKRSESLVVAAAGNGTQNNLAFPARFSDILAIGAVNSEYQLASFSNYGNQDHEGKVHPNHFVLPGGESSPGRSESIGTFDPHDTWYGTSFAVAYASGLIANIIAQQGTQRDTVLNRLRQNANQKLTGYCQDKYGNGLMRM